MLVKINMMTMKRFLLLIAIVSFSLACSAEEKPVTFDQIPSAARTFIESNFPGEKVSYALMDDDLIRPDYEVVLSNGVRIQFEHDGSLEKIESRTGVPESLVPVQIRDYVNLHYPESLIVVYEIGRKTYEVKLSNRLELKFSSSFNLIEVDD